MKRLILFIILPFLYIFLLPHLLCYYFASCKEEIIGDVMASIKRRETKLTGLNALVYILFVDKFYRKLFYHRIGAISYFVRWYFPGESTFYPMCEKMGGGMYLAHPTSTFLNAKSIGENFTCRQNTTIGNKNEGDNDSRPVIGDNVTLGANVCIIGNVKVGNNVIVGAGSVIVKDIPDNCIVVGNPARVLKR